MKEPNLEFLGGEWLNSLMIGSDFLLSCSRNNSVVYFTIMLSILLSSTLIKEGLLLSISETTSDWSYWLNSWINCIDSWMLSSLASVSSESLKFLALSYCFFIEAKACSSSDDKFVASFTSFKSFSSEIWSESTAIY